MKSRYIVGIIGIAVGIYGIVSSIQRQKKRKKMQQRLEQWSDQQSKDRYLDPTRKDTIRLQDTIR